MFLSLLALALPAPLLPMPPLLLWQPAPSPRPLTELVLVEDAHDDTYTRSMEHVPTFEARRK